MKSEKYIGLVGGVWIKDRVVQAYENDQGQVSIRVENSNGKVFGEKTVSHTEFAALYKSWGKGCNWGDARIALRAMGTVLDWEAA